VRQRGAINISSATFVRLQRLAVPLVDDIETVINRLIDSYERQPQAATAVQPLPPLSNARAFDPASPPDLTHTKVLSVKFDGKLLARGANWNGLMMEAIRKAAASATAAEDLKRLIIVNFVHGRKEDEGYKYMPGADISVQGQDANSSWSPYPASTGSAYVLA